MALTLATSPPAVGGTRRPIIVQFTTDTLITSGGVNNTVEYQLNSGADADQVWVFNFNGFTVTMTAKSSPANDGSDFQAGTTTASAIAASLNKNYLLSQYWTITAPASNMVRFVAKSAGVAWNLSTAGSTYTGFTEFTFIDGEDPTVLPNFQVWLDLYLEQTYGSGTYAASPVAKLAATQDSKSKFTFDLSALLDAYTDDAQPDLSDAVADYFAPELLQRYRFTYNEAWGSPIEPRGLTTSGTFAALRGRKANSFEGLPGNSFTGTQALTARNTTKRATTDQPEFVRFLLASGHDAEITVTIRYTDGSTVAGLGAPVAIDAQSYPQVWEMPAGHDQLSLDTITPAKTIERWWVNISYNSAAGDLTYYFDLENACPPHRRFFVFRNELGGYDTLACHGRMAHLGDFERQQARRSLPANYGLATDRERIDYQSEASDRYEIHTGFHFTKADLEYYARQFLRSENVLLYEGGSFVPVTLLTDELQYSKDRLPLYGFPFRFRRSVSHRERHGVYLK